MTTNNSIIISGSEYFMHRLEELLKEQLPQEVQLCAAREQQLIPALNKNNYCMALIEKCDDATCVLLRQVKQHAPATRIILFDSAGEKAEPADLVLPKKLTASAAALIKELYLNPHDAVKKVEDIKNGRRLRLTERMLEVFQGIWEELTNETIAERLFITERTVEGHREKLYLYADKAETVLQLMKFALKAGWITSKATLSKKFYRLLSGEIKGEVKVIE